MHKWLGTEKGVYRFAAQHGNGEIALHLELGSETPKPDDLEIRLGPAPPGCRVEIGEPHPSGHVPVLLIVPAAPPAQEDDELTLELQAITKQDVSPCQVVLRRTRCRISTALMERDPLARPLRPQARAALLWYSWRRYQEVIALKRFTSGKTESDVLVFRPRLRDPEPGETGLQNACLEGVVANAWGSSLLVKTGTVSKAREEWDRFQTFLSDRLHPFMARAEAFLTVRPAEETPSNMAGAQALPSVQAAGEKPPDSPQATVIGSFLGGELLQAEAFELLARGTSDVARCETTLKQLFAVLSLWYSGAATRPLKDWADIFRPSADGWRLFGKFDLVKKKEDRIDYAGALSWDVAFVKEAHLSHHLFGKIGDGLLHRIAAMPARFSLVHGDLHPRNVLADRDNVWLLDFGDVGIAPTLADFAKLEVYLRLWCLSFSSAGQDFEHWATQLETHLLDHMTASEGSLEPVRALAPYLGLQPEDLLKIADCIATIRRLAAPYSLGSPDRRDYLAVLFLTVLKTLRYAGSSPELASNFRLLMALYWVLEDSLSLILGLPRFSRERPSPDAQGLIHLQFLAAPAAPARVLYLLSRPDGQKALAPLAATRGVLQGSHHHLDVLDHTLVVLAYLEELLKDPVEGLCDPAALDARTDEALKQQGFNVGPLRSPCPAEGAPDLSDVADALEEIRALLRRALEGEAWLLLKWVALLHDVGKPATRCISGPEGKERIQFLGHEVYGLSLLAGQLKHLFPESERRARAQVERLIRWHHTHHTLASRYAASERLAAIRSALRTDHLPAGEDSFLAGYLDPEKGGCAADFPLLILHGFADSMACRGPASGSLIRTAETDLILLALYARYPRIRHRKAMEERFREMAGGLNEVLGMAGPPLGRLIGELKEWFLKEVRAGSPEAGDRSIPSREEFLQRAQEIRDHGRSVQPVARKN